MTLGELLSAIVDEQEQASADLSDYKITFYSETTDMVFEVDALIGDYDDCQFQLIAENPPQ